MNFDASSARISLSTRMLSMDADTCFATIACRTGSRHSLTSVQSVDTASRVPYPWLLRRVRWHKGCSTIMFCLISRQRTQRPGENAPVRSAIRLRNVPWLNKPIVNVTLQPTVGLWEACRVPLRPSLESSLQSLASTPFASPPTAEPGHMLHQLLEAGQTAAESGWQQVQELAWPQRSNPPTDGESGSLPRAAGAKG